MHPMYYTPQYIIDAILDGNDLCTFPTGGGGKSRPALAFLEPDPTADPYLAVLANPPFHREPASKPLNSSAN